MNLKTLNTLEFDKILTQLSKFAVCEPSKKEILKINPSSSLQDVNRSQQLTAEAYDICYKYLLNPIIGFDDCLDILHKAKAGAMLNMAELLKIARLMRSGRIAKKEIASAGEDIVLLKNIVGAIYLDIALENDIKDSIASENEMKDDASDSLKTIRRKIIVTNNRLKEKLNSYTRSSNLSKYLQDNLVTIRAGRFVLPVKSECRSAIPGLIHDQSASGSTVFIEPFPVVDLNNDLKSLQLEEIREIERILQALSDRVALCHNELLTCFNQGIMLDIVFSKMAYSVHINGIKPQINNKGHLNLINARHPLIDKNKVVPVTITTGKDYRILLITGPNTGGKTVCLKTAGLICLMVYCGLWSPCDDMSEVAVFDDIFCDIGDEQSIANSLSTFSSHMVNIVNITNLITPQSLVLLDELGAGTDPGEGAALSIGIIKYLELIKCVGIITTHYSELKEFALLSENLMNSCMQFDEKTLSPTFKLIIGLPGTSNALKIAKNLGINDFIIKNAQENLKIEKVQFEKVLQQAESVKSAALKELNLLEDERARLIKEKQFAQSQSDALTKKLERINANAKMETKRIVNNSVAAAEEIIENIKELLKEADETALLKAKQLKRKLEDMNYDNDNQINLIDCLDFIPQSARVNDTVIVKSLGCMGKITSLNILKQIAQVNIGNARTNVKFSDLALPINTSVKTTKTLQQVKETESPTNTEIKVLGHTVSEAIEVIEPIIASLSSGSVLKVVHGKGTGALSKGLHSYFKTNSSIKSFRYGRYGEGETGVTIIEIK